tara:strand:+ start:20703 stop:23138 length:2436 start_codon:yes stop_codon:yes gene_type:complete
MGDQEKNSNAYLASWIFQRYQPKTSFDIGCGYPYLAHCFSRIGVDALAIDGSFKDGAINNDLEVETLSQDWENYDSKDYYLAEGDGVDLITMIHSFEHFMDPITALKRAYDNLSEEGVLYLRSPNKDVPGIERDHTEGHAQIHPNIFGTESLKYAAIQAGFHLIWYEHAMGYGQTSWVFKKRSPTVSLCMIVKNEEKNILDCLATVKNYPNEVIIVDTGSTDNTIKLATAAGADVYVSDHFDEFTEFEDFHFAKARNESLAKATGDWVIWMDADDRFEGPEKLDLPADLDGWHVGIQYGDMRFQHARMFRNGWGVHFKGAIHEYPVIHQCRMGVMPNAHVTHISQDKPGRVERNLKILEKEAKDEPNNKRAIFYLGNAYREAGKTNEAIQAYNRYIATGGNFQDELLLTHYYKSVCYYLKNDWKNSIKTAYTGLAMDDRWAELYCCIGESYYYLADYYKAINFLNIAMNLKPPKTDMFVRNEMYGPVPKHWISLCWEALGDFETAKRFAITQERIDHLNNKTFVIEVSRQGALGDVLCTTPAVRELRKKHPKAHIRYVTHPSSKQILDCNPDINEIVTEPGKHADKRISFDYPMQEGYPDVPLKKHLAHYFADCAGVKLSKNWRNVLNLTTDGQIALEYDRPIITFAVRTGWSRYKEWPLEKWKELIKLFPGHQFIQLGAKEETKIPGAHHMMGKLTLRESFAVMRQSVIFVGLDSVFQHAANALKVPAVVLFGSTSPDGSGYEDHENMWAGLECSPCYREDNKIAVHKKPPCPYEHKCMKEMLPVNQINEVIKTLLRRIENTKVRKLAVI